MDMTARWALPLLFAGQAQKEIFHNEALARIDALLHGRAESADLATPPVAPDIGQCWIVAPDATGEWAGQEDAVACWTEGGWRFVAPKAGLSLAIADRGYGFYFDGSDWRGESVRGDGVYLDEDRIVGPRQPAIATPVGGTIIDTEARNCIESILDALRAHGLIVT